MLDSKQETGPFCSQASFWTVNPAGREVPVAPPKKQGGRAVCFQCHNISLQSRVEGKKKHRHVDHIFWTQAGEVQETPGGTTASPGPWKSLDTPLTRRPPEHSDTRYFKSTQRSYINIPSSPTPLFRPSLLWLRVWRHWFWGLLPHFPPFPGFLYSILAGSRSQTKKVTKVKSGGFARPPPPPQTSVCRSMMSCPTKGMVVLVFSQSTECSSRGEAARGSRSLRTQAGGDCGIPRTPSHGLSRGACCLSCWSRKRRHVSIGVAHQPPSNSWFNQKCDGFHYVQSDFLIMKGILSFGGGRKSFLLEASVISVSHLQAVN